MSSWVPNQKKQRSKSAPFTHLRIQDLQDMDCLENGVKKTSHIVQKCFYWSVPNSTKQKTYLKLSHTQNTSQLNPKKVWTPSALFQDYLHLTLTIWNDLSSMTSFTEPKCCENLVTSFGDISSIDSPPMSLSPATCILETPAGTLKILSCLTYRKENLYSPQTKCKSRHTQLFKKTKTQRFYLTELHSLLISVKP